MPQPPRTFLVSALGRVPNWGSVGLSTGLLISDGTDSVLLIFVTEKTVWRRERNSFNETFYCFHTINYIEVPRICRKLLTGKEGYSTSRCLFSTFVVTF